jgi:hypothetical protein
VDCCGIGISVSWDRTKKDEGNSVASTFVTMSESGVRVFTADGGSDTRRGVGNSVCASSLERGKAITISENTSPDEDNVDNESDGEEEGLRGEAAKSEEREEDFSAGADKTDGV